MSERTLFDWVVWFYFALGAMTFISLFFITAPYGRHERSGWGPKLPWRASWILMEAPASLLWLAIYAMGTHALDTVPLVLLGFWQLHYVQRTFVYPFRFRAEGRSMPVLVVVMAIAFNVLNAYTNARWVSELGTYNDDWARDPRFIVGAALFLAGWAANVHSDGILARLRKPGERGHKIPRGGLYELISCPNYAAEIVEWSGWALMTWSWGGLAFALYTIANLAPRALSHHRWYREKFPDYPAARRAIVPFLL
jgi:protein-S-isoprenylcysteine O-methyltransferase Ste14